MDCPLTLVVRQESTGAWDWYPPAYHNWYTTTNKTQQIWSKNLNIPNGALSTVTTLAVSILKKLHLKPILLVSSLSLYWINFGSCLPFLNRNPFFTLAKVALEKICHLQMWNCLCHQLFCHLDIHILIQNISRSLW